MSQTDLRERIIALLQSQTTLSLSTCDADQRPWATNLFYVSDDALNLYFVSSESSLHCQQLQHHAQVAATIHRPCEDWGDICGLQVQGRACAVSGLDQAAVLARYVARFGQLAKLLRAPVDAQQRAIAKRLLESRFYRIEPRWIRLIDNSRGFSHKEELLLD